MRPERHRLQDGKTGNCAGEHFYQVLRRMMLGRACFSDCRAPTIRLWIDSIRLIAAPFQGSPKLPEQEAYAARFTPLGQKQMPHTKG